MSRIPKHFRFQQDISIPCTGFSIQDLNTIYLALTGGNRDLVFHYATKVTSRSDSFYCGTIDHDATEVELGKHHINVRFYGRLLPEHTQALAPKLLGDRLFPSIPIIYQRDNVTGELSVIGVSHPILRYVPPPPPSTASRKSRMKYITPTSYLEYLNRLDAKEGRTSDVEALDGLR